MQSNQAGKSKEFSRRDGGNGNSIAHSYLSSNQISMKGSPEQPKLGLARLTLAWGGFISHRLLEQFPQPNKCFSRQHCIIGVYIRLVYFSRPSIYMGTSLDPTAVGKGG